MRAKELRELSIDELNTKLKELEDEYFNLRFQKVNMQLENTARLKLVRKDIARIKTILTELSKSK